MDDRPKLIRTRLSLRPDPAAIPVSVLSLAIIALLFALGHGEALDPARYSASFAQVFSRHEYWRAFTAPFMHADFGHLASNSLFFAGFAYLLRGYFGFWVFPVLSLLAGGLINLLILPAYPADASIIGASGIVYFMAAFWLTLYLAIERKKPLARRFMNAVAVALILFFPQTFQARVSYLSHAVGFGLGVGFALAYFAARRESLRKYEIWKQPEPAPVFDWDAEYEQAEAHDSTRQPQPSKCSLERTHSFATYCLEAGNPLVKQHDLRASRLPILPKPPAHRADPEESRLFIARVREADGRIRLYAVRGLERG